MLLGTSTFLPNNKVVSTAHNAFSTLLQFKAEGESRDKLNDTYSTAKGEFKIA